MNWITILEGIISFLRTLKWKSLLEGFLTFIKILSNVERVGDDKIVAIPLAATPVLQDINQTTTLQMLQDTTPIIEPKMARKDYEEVLKEVKQMFDDKLIDEEDYRLLRRKILRKYVKSL